MCSFHQILLTNVIMLLISYLLQWPPVPNDSKSRVWVLCIFELGHDEAHYFKLATTQFLFFHVESKTTQGRLLQNPRTCLSEANNIQLLSQTISVFPPTFPVTQFLFKGSVFSRRARIADCGTIARHASAPRLTQPQSPAQSGIDCKEQRAAICKELGQHFFTRHSFPSPRHRPLRPFLSSLPTH